MDYLHLIFANIHCGNCRDAVLKDVSRFARARFVDEDNVGELDGDEVGVSIVNNDVKVYWNQSNQVIAHGRDKLIKAFKKSGFKILSWEWYENNILALDSNSNVHHNQLSGDDGFLDLLGLFSKLTEKRSKRNHLKSCSLCQAQVKAENDNDKLPPDTSSDLSNISTVVENPDKEFRAVFSVEGMTCALCAGAIEEQMGEILDKKNFSVNLLQHTAVAIIPNKQLVNKIITSIDSIGFEARLLEVLPVQTSINRKVTAVIGGITCAACATAISNSVNELPFVLDCGINVVSKTGQFVLEGDEANLKKLQETVEDCGFDFELISDEKINYTSGKKASRAIELEVHGFFCEHCPETVESYFESFEDEITIHKPISLKSPSIKFSYIPNKTLNIRKFISDIGHLHASEEHSFVVDDKPGNFVAELKEQISIDEHIRKLTRREMLAIAIRLAIATAFAIPTFIFGIVAMSLLPRTNSFRIWVEEPIWVGNVSRNSWILLILSTPVYFFAADIFHKKAIKEIKSLWVFKNSFTKRFFRFGSMSLLMCIGTSIAYFASIAILILSATQPRHSSMGYHTTYFDSVVFLTFFLLIGRILESYSKSKTADAIAGLGQLKATLATLVEEIDGTFSKDETVDVKYLETGDFIRVSPGESPPVDCIIIEGQSSFDESALTGESTPVKHGPGHQIFSGTVNIGNNSIVAKIISVEGDSLIDQIVNTVRNGQLRKAPIERAADSLTGYFVPIITMLAILTWIIWLSLAYSGALPDRYLDIDVGGWAVWSLEFSLAVFVIACPCGIGLAAPTALFVGAGLAAKHGILAKGGGVAFQDGANTSVICFDKTGTLTYGDMRVTDYAFTVKDKDLKTIGLQVARDLELSSKHPIAKAVKSFVDDYATSKHEIQLSLNKVPQAENIAGKGLKGAIVSEAGDDIWNKIAPTEAILGNEALLNDYGVELTDKEKEVLNIWKSECKSVILVAIKCESYFKDSKHHLLLMIGARDQIRAETKTVIKYLQEKQKIECWMITGDNKITAEAIAKEIGIKNVISEVLPEEKESQVKSIQQKTNSIVAMIGDGINDAPALAAANVGIALSSGADLAVTSSDFILLNKSHPLLALCTLCDLARVVFRRVKFNFAWALIYNTIGIPIAAGVIYPYNNSRLDPVWASAAMALSSISVVLSSLALKLYKPSVKINDVDIDEAFENDEPKEFVF